jgi:hypothetical protein
MKIYLFQAGDAFGKGCIQAVRSKPEFSDTTYLYPENYPERESLCPDGVRNLLRIEEDSMPAVGEYITIEVKVL